MQELAAQLRAYYAQARYDQATVLLQQLAALGDRSAVRWQYALLLAGVRGDADAAIEAIHQLQALGDPLLVKALRVAWHHAVAAQHSELATLLAQTGWQLAPDDINFRLLNLFESLRDSDSQRDKLTQLTSAPLPLAKLSVEVLDQLIVALRGAGFNDDAARMLDYRAEHHPPIGEAEIEKLADLALTLDRAQLSKSLTAGRANPRLRYLQALANLKTLDWDALGASQLSSAELHALLQTDTRWIPKGLFHVLMMPGYTNTDHLALARRCVPEVTPSQIMVHVRPPQRRSRLRVGYLSGDFKPHPACQLSCPVFEAHDRSRFEWVAFDNTRAENSPERQRVLAAFDRVVPVRKLTTLRLAQAIQSAGIDVLVDMSGHTADHRLDALALRPAPVQMTWLGFPGGVGGKLADYLITDSNAVPAGADADFDEALIRLPGAYLPGGECPSGIDTPARDTQVLPQAAVVLACFNQHVKISAATFQGWCEILRKVPNSVLWLLGQGQDSRPALEAAAEQRGVARRRLVWAPRVEQAAHIQRIACADLVLDSHPYTMHTTAVDTLAAGVPYLTFCGQTLASRVSSSLLVAAGLDDCICSDAAEYLSRIIALATDSAMRERLRARFVAARQQSDLFNSRVFASYLEAAYDTAYLRWLDGLAPATFSVPARPRVGRA